MRENTNKAIVVNSVIMYLRLGITAIAGLFTTRFALQALGANDFGIFSVVGGIISLIVIVNTIMVSTSTRFISASIGKGDDVETNRIFNVSLSIHISIAVLMFCLAAPIGQWYITNYVNFDGDINDVIRVFNISIIGSILSFIGVPYNGLLIAKERFLIFCLSDVVFHIVKLLVAYLLIYHFKDKLQVYALTTAFCVCAPVLIYVIYCHIKWPLLTKWRLIKDASLYKRMFSFSQWVAYGAIAQVGRVQGATLLVNTFFNTIMNTALGIASSVKSLIMLVTQNLTKAISPQITKSYVAGNHERCKSLIATSSKFSFFVTVFISVPFIVDVEYLLELWLGQVPEYAPKFVYLMIVENVIYTFNVGVAEAIFANGNIKKFQLIINTNILLSIALAYILLKTGAPAYSMYYVFIAISVLNTFVRQWVMHKTLGYDNMYLIRNSYLPSIIVVILFIPFVFLKLSLHPILVMVVAEIYLCVLIFVVGLSKKERKLIMDKINAVCLKK